MRQRGIWNILAFVCLIGLAGCQSVGLATLDLANGIASLGAYERHVDIAYGPQSRQKLDVYTPQGRYRPDRPRHSQDRLNPQPETSPPPHPDAVLVDQGPDKGTSDRRDHSQQDGLPVVVYFHGGDWSDGYPGKNAHRFVADALTSRGFVAVIVNYRRYPNVKFPAFVRDGARAVAWTWRHIRAYGGDPNRLFVMGHSAGAHIGAMVCLDEEYLNELDVSPDIVDGFVGLAGPYNFLVGKDDPLYDQMPDDPMFKDMFGPPKRYPRSQPVNYVDSHEPPMLLLNGGLDQRVPSECTDRLARRVRANGASVRTKTYPHLDHLMLIGSLATPVRWVEPVIDDVAGFIRDHDVGGQQRPRMRFVGGPDTVDRTGEE